jgi:hypothetical protein
MRAVTLTAALLLAACAGPRLAWNDAQQESGPTVAAVKTARQQGCDSGYVAAGHPYYRFSKDTSRYVSDPVYKSDWDDGFAVCKGQYDAIGQAMRR